MFDKIIDVLLAIWDKLLPFTVVNQYQAAVVLRFGRFDRVLTPGFHWLWPVGIENALHDGVVTRTSMTSNQICTTADNKTVVLRAVLRWRIRDVKKALLDVEGLDDVTRDVTYGTIERLVNANTWEQVRAPGFTDDLTKAARKIAFRYGVEIEQLQFSDLSLTKSLTLNQN